MIDRLDLPSVDFVLNPDERTMPRPCATDDCEHDVNYYMLTDDVLSAYTCKKHLEETVEQVQA